jgi:hypothetical protein
VSAGFECFTGFEKTASRVQHVIDEEDSPTNFQRRGLKARFATGTHKMSPSLAERQSFLRSTQNGVSQRTVTKTWIQEGCLGDNFEAASPFPSQVHLEEAPKGMRGNRGDRIKTEILIAERFSAPGLELEKVFFAQEASKLHSFDPGQIEAI